MGSKIPSDVSGSTIEPQGHHPFLLVSFIDIGEANSQTPAPFSFPSSTVLILQPIIKGLCSIVGGKEARTKFPARKCSAWKHSFASHSLFFFSVFLLTTFNQRGSHSQHLSFASVLLSPKRTTIHEEPEMCQ